MKLRFDSTLQYQLDAIKAVTDLFDGMPSTADTNSVPLISEEMEMGTYTELGIANPPLLAAEFVRANLHKVQSGNDIPKSVKLVGDNDAYQFPNFSVEMETGTGKTYVYLRTIFELNRLYGFKKFIIVVPSVAIREGVTSSIKLMREHFRGLYENCAFDDFVYRSKDLSQVRQFARNNEIQIMVINIQAFAKDAEKAGNVIHQEQDKMSGRRPIEFVQATNPVVIIDEPQSVDTTPKSQKAIAGLNPAFCLRYSATHVNTYNLVYQLDPIRAYDLRLVKRIEVVDAESGQDFNRTMVRLDWIGYPGKAKTPQAKVTIFEDTPNGPREKQVPLKGGTDLSQLTNRADYDGYQVTNINAEPGNEYVEFSNGEIVQVSQETGGMADERMKSQIRQTVEQHFSKEKRFKSKGIKVLSLFFIDRVGSYRAFDEDGNPQKGKVGQWFEEAYEQVSNMPIYKGLIPYSAEQVHEGYFSSDKKKGKVVALLDTTGGTAKDDETYELIMRDKERLLSAEEPLRFIFSHSALREGWDNPNVFQICTLREMGTERERRQTIGRGLRLPVDSTGERVYENDVNRLTVIANESFADFATGLQKDIEAAIDPTGNFKFGRVPVLAFTPLLNPAGTATLTQEQSEHLWGHLQTRGFIDKAGDFTPAYQPEKPGFSLDLPPEFSGMDDAVLSRVNRFVPREFAKKAKDRELVKYNKRIELNEDFVALWEKINKKTRYSVEFKTEKLVERAAEKIGKMAKIEKVRIEITKREIELEASGVTGGKITTNKTFDVSNSRPLPDVLAFLQSQTELTRGTLVEILKKSGRLSEFTINPQAFMSECGKLVNRALNELIVEGIKYEPIAGQTFEMRLFEEYEVEEYLDRLYQIQNKDRNPYSHVVWESEIEHEVAERLDSDDRVRFFCKLPRWFKVPTPLGDYNPDWALVLEDSEKLYLVRETKSTLDRDKRRETENKKVDCGKAHFASLGVNFKDADSIHAVLTE